MMNFMELRDFLAIFIQRRYLIFGIVGLSLVVGFITYRLQHQWYQGTVLLSVTRQGAEAATDYQYDHYYRLQADEKMANTLARYLETTIGRRDIARRALLSGAREEQFTQSKVTALVLASNLVQVSYRARTLTESERIADAIFGTGERYVASLNEQAGDRNWFTLVVSEVFSRDDRFAWPTAIGIGGMSGLFIAFWTVLGLWYWRVSPPKAD